MASLEAGDARRKALRPVWVRREGSGMDVWVKPFRFCMAQGLFFYRTCSDLLTDHVGKQNRTEPEITIYHRLNPFFFYSTLTGHIMAEQPY